MVSISLPRFDGFTNAQVEGTLDPSLPLVVLLHGLSGTSLDMTDPATARPGTAFARNTVYPLYTDRGFRAWPPVLPVDSFFLDPPASGLTSWQQALNSAGLPPWATTSPARSSPETLPSSPRSRRAHCRRTLICPGCGSRSLRTAVAAWWPVRS